MTDIDWRRIPSLSSLRAFEASARFGSFTAAGNALNVTHAAITQQVRALEKDLGMTLLQREGRSMVLTEAGQQLAEALSDGFSAIAEGIERLREGPASRGLRVTCTPALSHAFIIPRLGQFWDSHPDIPVSLTPSVSLDDLRHRHFDLGIRTGKGDWPDVDVEPLWTTRVIAIVSPILIAKHGGDVNNLPLQSMPWIRSQAHADDLELMRQCGVDGATVPAIFIEGQSDSIQAVLRGLGMTFVSEIAVSDDLASGALVRLPFDLEDAEFSYFAARPKGVEHPSTRLFIDWLKTLDPKTR
ncbi:LysR substrate-binding domain-containing protein [Celeribacter neptunius]|uniref:LysR family transcriptional regulator, glycine cleavage system transcriptional activator n=1 Tax=Celeribacter neptunius TaxID=588602 RepID=A0A1I3SFR7_9RHOB|nr:LysR substrate-binding domain-containing protein [Celeribacter neptunius]SFJ57663.1 LysR family transcriptional regulator, glycine cleavage system transcriptional activator [Celeribacter neptunius]